MKKIIASIALLAPAVASAQALAPVTNINDVSSKLLGIGNIILYLLIAAAVIFIVWNVVMYLVKDGEDKSKSAGNILWGIVGLFIIVSIWGLVNILTNTFKTTPTNQPIPTLGPNPNTGGIPGNQIPLVP